LADGRWAPPEARDHHDDDAWCFAAEIWALRTFLNLESDDTTWSATLWEYQRRNGLSRGSVKNASKQFDEALEGSTSMPSLFAGPITASA
jgi:hypothetical protein